MESALAAFRQLAVIAAMLAYLYTLKPEILNYEPAIVSAATIIAIDQVIETDNNSDSLESMVTMIEKYIAAHHEQSVPKDTLQQYIAWAVDYTQETEIEPLWILAMVWQESRFVHDAKSSHGAIGLLQLLPSTAKSFGISRNDLYDPETNMMAGIHYLIYLLNKYEGDLRTATIAYNQGEGNVDRGKARAWYYNDVNRHYQRMINILHDSGNEMD